MAIAKAATVKQVPFLWEGTDKTGKKVKGEMLAPGEAFVRQSLRRQGITVAKVNKQGLFASTQKITEKGYRAFYPAIGNHVKGRRALIAVVRYYGAESRQSFGSTVVV